MPATAGRVRMPANNRVHSSAALQTHSIWQSAIGYDPYAPNKVNKPNSVNKEADNNKGAPQAVPSSDPDAENAYNSFQGLLALARVTNSNADEARGCCKKCGRVGHLNFQCRNFLSIKDDKDKDIEAIEAAVLAGLDKVKGNRGKGKGKRRDGVESSEESEEEEEESESSDSDYDSEIERAIAKNKKYGKNVSSLLKSSSRKKKKKDESDDEVSDREGRKKRGRSRKRRSGKKADSGSDTEDERRHGRRRGSRREKRRRRSRREAEGSGSSEGSDRRRERSSRRAAEDYNVSSSLEDSRVGRDGKKRYEKESRKQRYEREI